MSEKFTIEWLQVINFPMPYKASLQISEEMKRIKAVKEHKPNPSKKDTIRWHPHIPTFFSRQKDKASIGDIKPAERYSLKQSREIDGCDTHYFRTAYRASQSISFLHTISKLDAAIYIL
jgi:hypothetical protein